MNLTHEAISRAIIAREAQLKAEVQHTDDWFNSGLIYGQMQGLEAALAIVDAAFFAEASAKAILREMAATPGIIRGQDLSHPPSGGS